MEEGIGEVSEAQAVDLIEDLPPEQAAAILEELRGDLRADLLGQLEEAETQAILLRMPDQEASRMVRNSSPRMVPLRLRS